MAENKQSMLFVVLLQFCASKVVVVDDLGVTDKQYKSPGVAKKVVSALENTMRNSNDVVLLSNTNGTRRIVGMNPQDSYNQENNTRLFGTQGNNQGLTGNNASSPNIDNKGSVDGVWSGSSTAQNTGLSSFPRSMQQSWGPYEPHQFGPQSFEVDSIPQMKTDSDRYAPFRLSGDGDEVVGQVSNNMSDASRAKSSLIGLKMAQSRQKEGMLQNNIDRVLQEIDQVTEKTQDTKKMRDEMMSRIHTKRNHLRNLQSNKREVEMHRGRTLALVRLARNELLKLSKMMDDQKSKLALLEDEEKIFYERIKKYDEEYDMGSRELQLDDARMDEIKRNIGELEKVYNVLKSRNNELLNERNRESAMRNRLELETERLDRSIVDFI